MSAHVMSGLSVYLISSAHSLIIPPRRFLQRPTLPPGTGCHLVNPTSMPPSGFCPRLAPCGERVPSHTTVQPSRHRGADLDGAAVRWCGCDQLLPRATKVGDGRRGNPGSGGKHHRETPSVLFFEGMVLVGFPNLCFC